jgi:hypothetical protein
VDSKEATAALDEPLEGNLLVMSEHITGRAKENNRIVARQILVVEVQRVLGGINLHSEICPEFKNGLFGLGNVVVTEGFRVGENQDPVGTAGTACWKKAADNETAQKKPDGNVSKRAFHGNSGPIVC